MDRVRRQKIGVGLVQVPVDRIDIQPNLPALLRRRSLPVSPRIETGIVVCPGGLPDQIEAKEYTVVRKIGTQRFRERFEKRAPILNVGFERRPEGSIGDGAPAPDQEERAKEDRRRSFSALPKIRRGPICLSRYRMPATRRRDASSPPTRMPTAAAPMSRRSPLLASARL